MREAPPFDALVDGAPVGLLVDDGHRGCVYANALACAVLGLEPAVVGRRGWTSVLHPDSRDAVLATLDRNRLAGARFAHRVRIVREDGEVRWIKLRGAPLAGSALILSVVDATAEVEAEQSLARRAQDYRQLVELSDGIVVRLAPDGTILYASPSTETLLGLSPTDVAGHSAVEFIHPDDRDFVAGRLLAAVEGVQEGPTEFRLVTASGGEAWFDAAATVRHAPDGSVLDLVVNCRDIGERRRADLALQASEERYRTLVDSVREVIFQTDLEGRWGFLNQRWETVSGWTVAETLGRRWEDVVHPEDRDRHGRLLHDVIREHRGYGKQEIRLVTKHGAVRWIEVSARLARDAHGNAAGITGTLDDVTDRKVAEEELRRNEARFRALAENASDMVAVCDAEGRITYVSPSVTRILGYGERAIGTPVSEVIHPDDVRTAMRAVKHAQPGQQATEPVELRVRHHDGRWRWVEIRVTNRLGDPAVDGIILNSHDVTARREAEQALRHREARFRTLVQNASDSIIVVSGDGVLTYCSPAAERLLGFPEGSLVGRSATAFIHADDVDRVKDELAALRARGGISAPFEYRLVSADGSFRHVESIAHDLLADAEIAGFVVNTRDVTDRKRAEALLSGQTAILGMVARGVPLPETLEALAQLIEEHVLGARCAIRLSEGDGVTLRLAAAPSLPEAFHAATHRIAVDDPGPAAEAARRAAAVSVADLGEVDAPGHGLLVHAGLRVAEVVPFVDADGAVLGVIEVYAGPSGFGTTHRGVVAVSTHLAKVAVERQAAEDRLSHQALHDPLTGLPNRTLFLDRLAGALARSRRRRGHVAVLFLDLDRFKVVNDSLGHDRGDQLLVGTAERLQRVLRPEDTAARLGGDEFTILCEGVDGEDGARSIAERVAAALAEPFTLDDREVFVTASVGIALADADARPDDVMRDADAAMYRAKELGKARSEVFDEAMRERAMVRLHTENALYRALDRGELRLHYQPEVSLRTGEVVGVEALIRWEHPERGLVPPAEFVGLAEETGLIVPIGEWAIGEACRQAARWQDARPGRPLTVWVNLSARQLGHSDLPRVVTEALDATGTRPESLCLEITESVLMADVESTLVALEALHHLGIRLGIDDFGTGYSSLSYLQRFPVDFLKVDRSFVDGLDSSHEDRAIVAGVVNLGHALGLGVIAEGVERPEQLDELRRLDCDFAQGYLLGRPAPAEELDERLGVTAPHEPSAQQCRSLRATRT